MSRVRVVVDSCFRHWVGEIVERSTDHQGEYVLVRFGDDLRPLRFDAESVEPVDTEAA